MKSLSWVLCLFALLTLWCSVCNSRSQEPPGIFNGDSWVNVLGQDSDEKNLIHALNSQIPIRPPSKLWESPNTLIFVGLIDYRDARCAATIDYLFSRAKYPDRVRVGVVQQRHTEDDHFHCINDFCRHQTKKGHNLDNANECKYRSQLTMIEFTHQLARGPNYARYLAETLLTNEEFYLSIDSHMEVVEHWDVKMIDEWSRLQNEYAILSTQPPDIAVLFDEAHLSRGEVPHLCQWDYDNRGYIVPASPTLARNLMRPLLTTVFNPGFAFMRSHAVRKVPSDPLQQLIYDSDAFVQYARLWTHGYDVYSPSQVLLGHDYFQKMPLLTQGNNNNNNNNELSMMQWSRPRGDPDNPYFLYHRSVTRYRMLFGLPPDTTSPDTSYFVSAKDLESLTTYSLGNKRSLRQFLAFVGVRLHQAATGSIVQDRCLGPAPPAQTQIHPEDTVYTVRNNFIGDTAMAQGLVNWVPYYTDPDLKSAAGTDYHWEDVWVDLGDVWGHHPEVPAETHQRTLLPLTVARTLQFQSLASYHSLSTTQQQQQTETDTQRSESDAEVRSDANTENTQDQPHGKRPTGQSLAQQVQENVVAVIEYERGELWWVFSWLDAFLEGIIDDIDAQVGKYTGHVPNAGNNGQVGRHVVRVVLVVFPVFVFVLVLAIGLLMPAHTRPLFLTQLVQGKFPGAGGLPFRNGHTLPSNLATGKRI